MGHLSRAKCNIHSISAQTSHVGIELTKAKKWLRSYCSKKYTVPSGKSYMRTVGALAIYGIKSKSETALSSRQSSEVTRSRKPSEIIRGKSFTHEKSSEVTRGIPLKSFYDDSDQSLFISVTKGQEDPLDSILTLKLLSQCLFDKNLTKKSVVSLKSVY